MNRNEISQFLIIIYLIGFSLLLFSCLAGDKFMSRVMIGDSLIIIGILFVAGNYYRKSMILKSYKATFVEFKATIAKSIKEQDFSGATEINSIAGMSRYQKDVSLFPSNYQKVLYEYKVSGEDYFGSFATKKLGAYQYEQEIDILYNPKNPKLKYAVMELDELISQNYKNIFILCSSVFVMVIFMVTIATR